MKNEGNNLTIKFLKSRGFTKEVITSPGDDDEVMYIKDGITIYYDETSSNPFTFATYVRGDGRFKSGYTIKSDKQIKNLYFSLTDRKLNKVGSKKDIKARIELERVEIEYYNKTKKRYPNDQNSQDRCDIGIIECNKKINKLIKKLK